MEKKSKWLMRVMPLLVVLCACGRSTTTEEVQLPPPPEIETRRDFQRALSEAGANLTEIEALGTPIFEATEAVYLLSEEILIVYEFESVHARDERLSRRLKEGFSEFLSEEGQFKEFKIWSPGRLVVLFSGDEGGSILLLNGLMGDPVNVETPAQDEPFPPAISAVIQQLAERRGIDPTQVQVLDYETAEWENACLELPFPGEDCPKHLTPGWWVRVQLDEGEFKVRTDTLGSEIRAED